MKKAVIFATVSLALAASLQAATLTWLSGGASGTDWQDATGGQLQHDTGYVAWLVNQSDYNTLIAGEIDNLLNAAPTVTPSYSLPYTTGLNLIQGDLFPINTVDVDWQSDSGSTYRTLLFSSDPATLSTSGLTGYAYAEAPNSFPVPTYAEGTPAIPGTYTTGVITGADYTSVVIPEPGTLMLALSALLGFVGYRKLKSRG